MPAPVVSDNAEAFLEEEQHLVIPVVSAERPAVMEMDRLRVLRALVLVEDFGSVIRFDEGHVDFPFAAEWVWLTGSPYSRQRL
jgi:hypothetical protein